MTEPQAEAGEPAVQRWVEPLLRGLIALGLAFMTLVTFFDVVGRYFFGTPIFGAFQLTEFAMGLVVFAAIPILCAREKHVTVDLATNLFKGKLRRIRAVFVNALCAVAMGWLAQRLYLLGERYGEMGDMTMMLNVPLAPFAYAMTGFAVLATLGLLLRTWLHLTGRAKENVAMASF